MNGAGAVRRLLLYMLFALVLGSCSRDRVLFVNDPYFDSFASSSVRFYQIKKKLIFAQAGFRTDFLDLSDSSGSAADLERRLSSGNYSAAVLNPLVLGYLHFPLDIPTVLIGGGPDLSPPEAGQVLFSDTAALRDGSRYLYDLCRTEGFKPIIVFYDSFQAGEEGRDAFLSQWPEDKRYELLENWLDLSNTLSNPEKLVEDFFSSYDLAAEEYIVFAYCAPVMRSVMRYANEAAALILSVPDNPKLPSTCRGLIVPDYMGTIEIAANALNENLSGKEFSSDNRFIIK